MRGLSTEIKPKIMHADAHITLCVLIKLNKGSIDNSVFTKGRTQLESCSYKLLLQKA